MTDRKLILIAWEPAPSLVEHVSALALPRRAISTPGNTDGPRDFHAFVELWGPEPDLRRLVRAWPGEASAWLVDERSPVRYDRSWPSGTPSPGLRMISTLHRREPMSREAFAAHWHGPHTRIAASYTIPVWHYNQNLVVEALANDNGEDGFVGMHFETPTQLASRWADHPEEAARGAEDAERFMDTQRSRTLVAVETVWEE
jgi:hypothetical protein